MASINLGTFSDGFSGLNYTCYLLYDNVTRSNDNVTITNVRVRIVSQSSYGTEGRMAVSLNIPSGTNRVTNGTIANSYTYPTDTTYTVSSTGYTFSNLASTISYSVSFSDTGYGTTWNSTYSKTFTGSISCPARTYAVSYNSNGATSGSAPSAQSKIYGSNLTLSTNTGNLAKTGYILSGWNTNASGTGTHYALGGTYSTNAAVTLYAEWTLDTESYKFCIMWVWNGSAWKKAIPWMWNGSIWKSINSHIWK